MSCTFLQKMAQFERRRIAYTDVKNILEVIDQKLAESGVIEKPKSCTILGRSGVGKTTLIEGFISKHPQYYEQGPLGMQLIVPAFYFRIPAGATIKMIVDSMLKALGAVPTRSADAVKLTEQLETVIANSRVKLIFMDETQHLLKEQGALKTEVVRNWIKTFLDVIQIPVFFVGMESCKQFILSDEQIERRVKGFLTMQALDIPTSVDSDVSKIIKSLRKFLAEDVGISLCPNEDLLSLAQRMQLASGGLIAGIRSLIYDAAVFINSRKLDTIEIADLAEVFAISPPASCNCGLKNPFSVDSKVLANLVTQKAA